jgi:hypothetical protein
VITLTREEAQQVLDALAELNRLSIGKDAICLPAEIDDAMEILEARLAQPEPEPVAWEDVLGAIGRGWAYPENAHKTMDVELAVAIAKEFQELYTAPPQREWQGLTAEEAEEVERWVEFKEEGSGRIPTGKLIRYIEAKLKEKNA